MRNIRYAFLLMVMFAVSALAAEVSPSAPKISTGLGYYSILPSKTLLTSIVTSDSQKAPVLEWSKVSGPGNVKIERPNRQTTWAKADKPGKYVFKIKATDSNGTSESTIEVNVYPAGGYDGNPIFPGMFPDPHILFDNGTFYIFATSMENEKGAYGRASVWTSKDFVNWEMHLTNWPEYGKFGGDIWAPDILKWKGKYYQFVTRSGYYDTMIGVADNPLGPWKNLREDNSPIVSGGGNAGRIVPAYNMDSQPFVDDDGQVYMYWGWSASMAAKLTPDLKNIDGEVHFLKGTMWLAKGGSLPQWLMVDLGESMPITKIVSKPEFREVVYGYKIEVSNDKENWQTFADRTMNTTEKAGEGYVDNGSTSGRYVRITFSNCSGNWAGLYGFDIYSGDKLVSHGKEATASSVERAECQPTAALDSSYGPDIPDFVEGSYMLKRNGIYYLMYSSGALGDGSYSVHYAMGKTPFGPFTVPHDNVILCSNAEKTTQGPGHHSVLKYKGDYYIVYHQHNQPHVGADGVFRQACADKLEFNADGTIKKVVPTQTGIGPLAPLVKQGNDLAWGKYATATSVESAFYAPEYALDHNFASLWRAASNTYPQSLTVDLGKKHKISRVETSFEYPTLAYKYFIETSPDGKTWSKFADKTGDSGPVVSPCKDFGKATARFVKITITGCQQPEDKAGIYSLRVY